MTNDLDVLVMESHPGVAEQAMTNLQGAGHRVHRCFDENDDQFPCEGVRDPAGCPLERGVDVAVVVRRDFNHRPTVFESGVRCALRAGVPLVEQGSAMLDPYGPWLACRVVDDDVAGACVHAVDAEHASLRGHIERLCVPILARAGHVGPLGCDIERRGRTLHVRLAGPAVGKDVEQALAVRVLDVARSDGRTYSEVDVTYAVAA